MSDTADGPPDAVHPQTRAAWRAWLAKHHARPDGVWLVSYKKATGKPAVGYDAAVEEALCFGWVDAVPRKLDAERTVLYFAPRKAGNGWSGVSRCSATPPEVSDRTGVHRGRPMSLVVRGGLAVEAFGVRFAVNDPQPAAATAGRPSA